MTSLYVHSIHSFYSQHENNNSFQLHLYVHRSMTKLFINNPDLKIPRSDIERSTVSFTPLSTNVNDNFPFCITQTFLSWKVILHLLTTFLPKSVRSSWNMYMQGVRHAERGLLLYWTHDPVRFGNCVCSVQTSLSEICHVFKTLNFEHSTVLIYHS